MAYIVRNNLNGEKRPSTGVGITIPFDGPTGINSSYSTQQAIKSNLLNYLLTDNRERIFNPNFGSGIRGKLFEQLSTSTIDELKITNVSGTAFTVSSIIFLDNADIHVKKEVFIILIIN